MARFAAVAGIAVACGVEDRKVNIGSSLEDGAAHFALAFCDKRRQCFPGYMQEQFGTYDECVSRSTVYQDWVLSLPGITWTATALQSCADAWNRASCDQAADAPTFPDCKLPGTRGVGDPCNANDQCTTYFCKHTGYACGTCAEEPPPGSTCTGGWDCKDGTWCMPDGTCQAPSHWNEPCSPNLECTYGNCVGGSCTPAVGLGGHCDGTSLFCAFPDKALECDPTSSTCVAATAKSAGQACVGATYCERGGKCTNGACTAGPGDTGACDVADPLSCEWPAICVNGTCQHPAAPGLLCQN